jgi:alpha-amylase
MKIVVCDPLVRLGFVHPHSSRYRSRCALLALAAGLALACSAAPPPPPVARVQPPAFRQSDWRDAVLYFVLIDRFADGDPANDANVDRSAKGTFHGGDLKGLTEHLDEIADLGVTAIWINPVVKNIDSFVTGAGFPDWAYHGYWADDFTRLDPRFGSAADLKAFVDACHARGIRVLLDVVYNHAGYGSHYLTDPKTKSWLRSSELGGCGDDDVTSCVAGLPDFKSEQPEVADFLLNAQLAIARQAGVDGFRLDTVKHVDHPFWQEHRRRTRELLGKGFFLLGEVWGGDAQVLDPWFAGDEIDAGFDFSFQGSALGFVEGRGRAVAFDRYLKGREKIRDGYLVSHFLSSHDVPGGLFQLGGDTALFRLAAVLQFTSTGIPMIYYGEEVGRPGGDWPDNRSDMPWGDRPIQPGAGAPRDESLRADYIRLIALRRAHPALSRGTHTLLASDKDVLVFEQHDAASGDAVVVAVNRGAAPATVKFAPPAEWSGRAPADAWGHAPLTVAEGAVELTVAAKAAEVLVVSFTR